MSLSSGRIRLLYVVGNFRTGGAERHLLEMWSRLDRENFEVEIACFHREGQFLGQVEALGWPVHDLAMGSRLYGPGGFRAFARLIHFVVSFKPHVIHGYLFGPNLFSALAGRLCGVPVVAVAKRNVDAFETGRQIRVQQIAHRLATHVTAVSEAVAATAEDLGARRGRVTVIPNGVDFARFDAVPLDRQDLGLGGGAPVVGSVGRLAPRKDYPTLLESLALVAARGHAFKLVLVGDGQERAALESRARDLGLTERVVFLGDRSDVNCLLPLMDIFVLSSREEGIPNALLEAMAAGRPSIATAVGGTPEVLEDGRTGWLVPPHEPQALARALEDALARPDEARRRGEAARRAVIERMGIDTMVRRHEQFYRRALAEVAA